MIVRKVTDVEIHFASGEPACFTCDASRGDAMSQAENGERRYLLLTAPDVEEAILIPNWQSVTYARFVTRPAEDQSPPQHLPGGITIQGDLPEPD